MYQIKLAARFVFPINSFQLPGSGILAKNKVGIAVICGEKTFFHRKAPASYSIECGEFLRFLAVKIFFSPHSPVFLQKRTCRTEVRTSYLLHFHNYLFHCAICHLLQRYFLLK